MRELLGSPKGVEYAARDGMSDAGKGVGWWNVVFDYGGFKAHYEVCQASPRPLRCRYTFWDFVDELRVLVLY